MEYKDLLLKKEGQVAVITLNVPEKLNALTTEMRISLPLAVDEIVKDDEIRAVILTGAGRSFCSGADIARLNAYVNPDSPVNVPRYELEKVLGEALADIFPKLNKPVIAAINGTCVGVGFSIALSCDIRIASENAMFVTSQIARGLIPDGGMTYYLPLAIGLSKALELMFTAKKINATEAERLGIVSRVVEHEQLMQTAYELAYEIAKQAPISVELTKKIVWRGLMENLARQLDLESWAGRICGQSEDHKEGLRAFMEKRPPQFKGR